MAEVVLNLASWIERRKASVGPYSDHIIHSVKAYESEIERLRAGAEDARKSALKEAAEWHLEIAQHDQGGMDYSSLVGIPISNWDDLDTSVKTHEWCARELTALAGKEREDE